MTVIARHSVRLEREDDFHGWREAARSLLLARIPPEQVDWQTEQSGGDLFAAPPQALPSPVISAQPAVPRKFLELARMAALHSAPDRHDLLYRLLWRLQREHGALEDRVDPLVRRLHLLAKEVRRDIHKMRAFLRFRSIDDPQGERFVAWFEPAHHILRANAAFFVNRFAAMRWIILTPEGSLDWDGATLREGPPADRRDAPSGDELEALWGDYYAAIFNPARLNRRAMLKEMPRKYWANMPETALIPQLIAGARSREDKMVDAGSDLFADTQRPASLAAIGADIQICRRCPIGCNSTRAVAGEGPQRAPLMIVGEQPGDTEEMEGRPFVGPAGRLLRAALERSGIDESAAYVTNAVKHFKFSPRGKRRIHETPTAREIDICRWWLDSERQLIQPRLILALGASAARGVLGKTVSIGRQRGQPVALTEDAELWVTAHPSYLLRLRDDARERESERFAEDLKAVAERLKG